MVTLPALPVLDVVVLIMTLSVSILIPIWRAPVQLARGDDARPALRRRVERNNNLFKQQHARQAGAHSASLRRAGRVGAVSCCGNQPRRMGIGILRRIDRIPGVFAQAFSPGRPDRYVPLRGEALKFGSSSFGTMSGNISWSKEENSTASPIVAPTIPIRDLYSSSDKFSFM